MAVHGIKTFRRKATNQNELFIKKAKFDSVSERFGILGLRNRVTEPSYAK